MRLSLSILAAGLAASPALAGNLAPVAPEPVPVAAPVAPAPIYDWTGFFVGASVGYADVDAEGAGLALEGDGTTFGVRAGYDFDLGTIVAGGIIEYDEADVDLGAGAPSLENVLRVGGRLGYDSGRNLFYGTAGYAQAETDVAGDADGYFVGAGYEVFLTEAVTVGAEALYHEFDDFDAAPGVEAEATTVGLNLNFRF